jgi:hypothetical protein
MQEDNDIILANALLGYYLDNGSNDEIAQVCDRLNVTVGGYAYNVAMGRAVDWLKTGKNAEQLTPENRQKLLDMVATRLVQELGAVPGKDISSSGDGSLLISDALIAKICAISPPGMLDRLKARTNENET